MGYTVCTGAKRATQHVLNERVACRLGYNFNSLKVDAKLSDSHSYFKLFKFLTFHYYCCLELHIYMFTRYTVPHRLFSVCRLGEH